MDSGEGGSGLLWAQAMRVGRRAGRRARPQGPAKPPKPRPRPAAPLNPTSTPRLLAARRYQQALGVPELTTGRSARDLLTARWAAPSLSVVDVRLGTAADYGDATCEHHYRFGPTR